MKLTSLVLQNIGIFKGNNKMDFVSREEKNIILIGGMNGRGKTTILESILFALYGKYICTFLEGEWDFRSYLKRLSSDTDEKSCYVELTFQIEQENSQQEYKIKREWEKDRLKVKEYVWKNGKEDKVLAQNWDMFIEEILPHAIAPFFFFDGEKISELASADNDEQMIESVKNLLGLNVLEQSMMDIKMVIKKCQKKLKMDDNFMQLEELSKKVEEEKKEILNVEADYKKKEEEYKENKIKLEKLDQNFLVQGGGMLGKREQMYESQNFLQSTLMETKENLRELSSGDLPLYLVKPLLMKVKKVVEKEHKLKNQEVILETLPKLYEQYSDKTNEEFDIEAFLNFVRGDKEQVDYIYNMTQNGLQKINFILENEKKKKEQVNEYLDKIESMKKKLESIEDQLAVHIDEEVVQETYKKIKEITGKLAINEEERKKLQKELSERQAVIERNKREERKLLDKIAKEIDNIEDTNRIIAYAGKALKVIEAYKKKLQAVKTEKLSETISKCFETIASKEGLIDKVTIDSETLKFQYWDNRQKEVNKNSLSAGEKQLLVISILWGLAICSEKELPVIIDTPLGRLDSIHREALLKNYFPKASKQMIILSTDQEITVEDYKMLQENIGKEYTLVYSDESRSSKIKDGYFGG